VREREIIYKTHMYIIDKLTPGTSRTGRRDNYELPPPPKLRLFTKSETLNNYNKVYLKNDVLVWIHTLVMLSWDLLLATLIALIVFCL
jgi:hypothetical protein